MYGTGFGSTADTGGKGDTGPLAWRWPSHSPCHSGARHVEPLGVTYGSDEVMAANAAFIAAANPTVVAELVYRLQAAEGLNELRLQTLNPVQPGGLVLVTLGYRHRAWRDEVVVRVKEAIKAAFPDQPVLCVADWIHIKQLSKEQLRDLGFAIEATTMLLDESGRNRSTLP
ncbi:hypothetical protein D3C72_1273490 [compost metagenome]